MTQASTVARPKWILPTRLLMDAVFTLFFLFLTILCATQHASVSAIVFCLATLFMARDSRKHWQQRKAAITAKNDPAETFSFCVCHPWEEGGTSIKVYAYGTQVLHGDMEHALEFRSYVREKTGEDYEIYKLVPIPKQ